MCSTTNVAATGIYLFFGVLLSSGNPIREKRSTSNLPWASPCGIPTPVTGNIFPIFEPAEPTLAELASELHTRSLEGFALAVKLRDALFQRRLGLSLELALALDGDHLSNYPLPTDVLTWTSSNNTGNAMKKDFTNLSSALVYLEAVRLDDIEYHNGSSLVDINSLENKLLGILCTIESVLKKLSLVVDSHVTRDVIPEGILENTNSAIRHQRDYIIAKDSVHLMTSTKKSHLQMTLGIQ